MLGKCMGIAMIGDSFGTAVGQPVGGVLYTRLGWNAPAIFALALGTPFCRGSRVFLLISLQLVST